MFPWKTVIQLDTQSVTPLYLQMVNTIIREITSGRLPKGRKVPGSRAMADLLSLNRKTVVQAYDELMAQGWLEVFPSTGTFVSTKLPIINPQPLHHQNIAKEPNELLIINSTNYTDYNAKPPHTIEINQGTPDHRLAPVDWIYKESRSITKGTYGKNFLKYGTARGDESLRIGLARYLSETRGMDIDKENILITRGSQMGIFMIFNMLLSEGDRVVVGNTSYDAADWTILHHKGILERVEVDEKGLNINKLEAVVKTKKIKAVYITPHHHFPTTVTLSADRRIQLLELALKYNFAIIEDDYDYDFHYSSSPLLPLASLNHHEHVIYVGSFSKIFAPAIRIGYVISSARIINELSKIRGIVDRQGDLVMERVMALAIEEGELQKHLKKTLKIYLSRRNLFCQLLKEKFGDDVKFKIPEGGMAIWTTFSEKIKLHEHLSACLKKGLYLNAGKDFAAKYNALRLGFASVNEKEITEAMDIMSDVIR